jgi:hypothetical protein
MNRRLLILCLVGAAVPLPVPAQPGPPKLVVGIVVDQFRYDYLTRFRAGYTEGLDRLLKRGAVFTNARYQHFPTVTAIGHATFLTGATPSLSGIVGNEWFDRETGRNVTSVGDDSVRLLGGAGAGGSSPRRLMVSTIGDEMKIAWRGKPCVIGISLKDRAAILPAGHMADGAYWFDDRSGGFASSTFYFPALPAWVAEFNSARPADRYAGVEWKPLDSSPDYPAFSRQMAAAPGPDLYRALEATPYGNELVEAFAERAIDAENLGRRGATDLLIVSFSANDYVGHDEGPDSPQVRDMALRTDRLLGKFFAFLESKVGLENVLVVFAADHGVASVPEVLEREKMPGGRLSAKVAGNAIQAALAAEFGEGQWIASQSDSSLYLNLKLIRQRQLNRTAVERAAAAAALDLPHVFRVYTREQLLNGTAEDPVARRVANGFLPSRSGDLVILTDPYWIASNSGTTHGSVFEYDSHVPVIFMGPGIRPGRYHQVIAPNDIAPTLATMLAIETPGGAYGRVLREMLLP